MYWQDDRSDAMALKGENIQNGSLVVAPLETIGFYLKLKDGSEHKLLADCDVYPPPADKPDYRIDCGDGHSLPPLPVKLLDEGSGSRIKAFFLATYHVKFGGENPVYPLERKESNPIDLDLGVTPGEKEKYHPKYPSFFPKWAALANPNLHDISNDELLAEADGGILKAADLAARWDGNPEYNWLVGSGYLLLIAAGWLFWPFGRKQEWHIKLPDQQKTIDVNFNLNPSPPMHIGELRVMRTPRRFGVGRLLHWTSLAIEAANPPRLTQPAAPVKPHWGDGLPLAIANEGETEWRDKRAMHDSRYSLLFDPGQLRDLSGADGSAPLDAVLEFTLSATHGFKGDSKPGLKLRAIPEQAKFKPEANILCDKHPRNHNTLQAAWRAGGPLVLVRFTLSNLTGHRFCETAAGSWVIESKDKDKPSLDGQNEPQRTYGFAFRRQNEDPQVRLDYALGHGESLTVDLVADFSVLDNPYDPRHFNITIKDATGTTLYEYTFILKRSHTVTDVELEVFNRSSHRLHLLDERHA